METSPAPFSASVASEVEKRLAKLARFAGADHRSTPARLRQPFSAMNWNAMPEDVRRANLRARLTEQVVAARRAKNERNRARKAAKEAALLAEQEAPTPAEEAPAPVAEDAPAPAPASPSRYVVACVAGCGTFHPATSYRPTIVTCGKRGRTAPTGKYTVYDTTDTEALIAKFQRQAKASAGSPEAPARRNVKKSKAPKKRRRAVCVNSR